MQTEKEIIEYFFRVIKNAIQRNTIEENKILFCFLLILFLALVFLYFSHKRQKKKQNLIESEKYSTLMQFVVTEDVEGIQTEVLQNKADIDLVLDNGQTALMIASKLNKVNSLVCLIQLNANVFLRDNNGDSAYGLAKKEGNTVVVEILRPILEKEISQN
jgi:ankyrin repeat protein